MTLISTDQMQSCRALGVAGFVLITLALLVGCNNSQTSSAPAATPKAATIAIDAATAGSIRRVISLKGVPPKLKPLDMTQDPGCPSSAQPPDAIVVNGGRLANVFVYVKEGLPQGTFSVPSDPVVLDQKGCRYNPHML